MSKTKLIAVLIFRCLMVVVAMLAGSGLMAWTFAEDLDAEEED